MDNVIKSFLTVFCILMFFFTMSGVIYAGVAAKNADGYAKAVTQEVSECDFSQEVENQLTFTAKSDKYDDLTFENIDIDNDVLTDMAYVTLKYTLKVPFFGYERTHYIKNIAR